jgi:DNA-binding beta-propeller fold protein YncE
VASVALAACGTTAGTQPRVTASGTGLVLMSMRDGSQLGSAPIGSDPVAVTVSSDGKLAYVADSSPGDVYAVSVPALTVIWRQHVGGSPFGLLLHGGRLFVSLFASAEVLELDPASGARLATHAVPDGPAVLAVDGMDRVMVAARSGRLAHLDGGSVPAGAGFAVAVSGREVWTADYGASELVRVEDGRRVMLPQPLHPFWIATGPPGKLLIAAEGADEDSDAGGVFEFDIESERFTNLATPHDPDLVLQSGGRVLVAAHGDKEVLVINDSGTWVWSRGAAAVALATVPGLNAALVVVNDHE